MTTISRLLVANRGEIARRVFATCRRLGIETVAVHSDADAGSPYVREADRAVRLPGTAPADTYLRADLLVEAATRTGADAIHPGLRLPLRERRLRARRRGRRAGLGGANAGVDRADGLQDRGEADHGRRRSPGPRGAGRAHRGRPPAAGQGLRRGRRPRHADRAHPRRPARRARGGHGGGGVRVRRRHRLRRAVRRGGPARRGPGARSPRRRPRARRARLLDPAPAPEGGRGGAGAPAARGHPGRAPRGGGGRGRGDRLPRRRHRGVPLRPRPGLVLLPGDEHPPPGRAPGHRAGLRRRPRRPPARRGRGPAPRRARRGRGVRARHRGAAVRRGPRRRLAAAERAAHRVRGPGRDGGVRPPQPARPAPRRGLRDRATWSRRTTTRCSPR